MAGEQFKKCFDSNKTVDAFLMNINYYLNLPNNFNQLYSCKSNTNCYTNNIYHKSHHKIYVISALELNNVIRDTINNLMCFNNFNHCYFTNHITPIINKLKKRTNLIKDYMNNYYSYVYKNHYNNYTNVEIDPIYIVHNLMDFHVMRPNQTDQTIDILRKRIIKFINYHWFNIDTATKAKCFIVASYISPRNFSSQYHIPIQKVHQLWHYKTIWTTATIGDIKLLNHVYDQKFAKQF